jgi:glycerate 2-kinase
VKKHALQIFRAALHAADPARAVERHLRFDGHTLTAGKRRYRISNFDRIQLIGAGKAAPAMARAVERILGTRLSGGIVNVKDGDFQRTRQIELNPSGHPVPDQRGVEGARRIANIARQAGPRDFLICVISGGASALMPAPAAPVTLATMQELTRLLLASGATIHELNTVRKHISDLSGGQLARLASPASILTLILSDVVGDDLDVIGSGPTVGDRSTFADVARIFQKFAIDPPSSVRARIERGVRGEIPETPQPGDPVFDLVQNLVVGSNRMATDAAAAKARELGYRVMVLSTFIEGETREIAAMHAAIVKEIHAAGRPLRTPACILSGGETTVTVRGRGLGGRNQEFVLAAALALDGGAPATIFSAGTDGIDGPTDAAGAIANERTIGRARSLGLDPRAFLDNNDSYHFFEPLNALVKTGPTGTNVADLRIMLIPEK